MTPKVTVTGVGREGTVSYADGLHTIRGYWSFGGGDVVAIVSMGSREEWEVVHPWAVSRRLQILRLVADEVMRLRAPSCRAEIDEALGDIRLVQGDPWTGPAGRAAVGAQAADSSPEARAVAFVHRYRRLRNVFAATVAVVALVVGAVFWVGRQTLYVAPASGVPLNASLRTDHHIATLIQSTDPHLPEISGRGGNTTTSVSILLIPVDGSQPRLVPVTGRLAASSFALARIFGSDGQTLWFDAAGLFGVRLTDYELVRADDLQRVNPELAAHWWADPRGMDLVGGRLHVVNADRSAALDVDPVTWRANPATPTINGARFNAPGPADYMAAGFMAGSGVWLGLHASGELDGEFRPGKWVRAVAPAVDAKQPRRLFLGQTESSPDVPYNRILGMTPLGEAEYLNAAFLRLADKALPLRLDAPDSVLMAFTSAPGPQGTLVVARVDLDGRVLWTTDTGLDRFLLGQILPGEDTFAFVGTRPPIPDQLAEPLVVLVDNHTGTLTSHSLWR